MIKASELRTGNILHYGTIKKIIEVESIYYNGINVSSGYEGSIEADYNEKDLFGIPITPEILEKCGLNKSPFETKYRFCDEHLLYKEEQKTAYFIVGVELEHEIYVGSPMRYLHQLQNLYFALTGKELEINLNVEVSDSKFHLR